MGLETELRKFVFKGTELGCPAAFSNRMLENRNCVYLNDALTKGFAAMGPRHDYSFTGRELCQYFFTMATTQLNNGGTDVYIFVLDYEPFVPAEKAAERKRRDASRKRGEDIPPYPHGTTFSWEGCRVGGRGDWQRIDIRRVLYNRSLRPMLWRLIIDFLGENIGEIALGKTLIVDHFQEGAYMFHNGECTVLLHTRHRWGEADLGMVYWIARYRQTGKDFIVDTTDTDQFCILTHYLHSVGYERGHPGALIWTYGYGNWVDMKMFTQHLRQTVKWSDDTFLKLCIMVGTDFCNKADMWFYIGAPFVFCELLKCRGLIRGLFDSIKNFVKCICIVYGQKLGITRENGGVPRIRNIREFLANKRSTKYQFPDDRTIRHYYECIKFNYQYWSVNWSDPSVVPQEPPMVMSIMPPEAYEEMKTQDTRRDAASSVIQRYVRPESLQKRAKIVVDLDNDF